MTEFPPGLHPGAIWRKSDFQVHTPRDPDWKGSPHLPGGGDAENARAQWAELFVTECEKRNLTAIAITDHHDYAFINYIRAAIDKRKSSNPGFDLWLFPGVEITCDDEVQCIALFDVDSDVNTTIVRLLNKHSVPPVDLAAAINARASVCGAKLEALIQSVSDDEHLDPRTIVLPHGGPPTTSHKSVLADNHTRFSALSSEGVYVEVPFSKLDQSSIEKLQGKTPEWGRRRRGILTTGDNRNASFERLGAHECWVRLGEPTAEAIRQALLVDEARISHTPPGEPHHLIHSFSIRSKLTSSVSISMNSGLNTFIGGRGTGKSALLEYLRFGLGISEFDISETTTGELDDEMNLGIALEQFPDNARLRNLVTDTLEEVVVELERNGVREVWTRSVSNPQVISAVIDQKDKIEISPQTARERFPSRGFHQKQLSGIVSDTRIAGDQVTTLAAAEFIEERRKVDSRVQTAKSEIRSAVQRLYVKWQKEAELLAQQQRALDIERQVKALSEKLKNAGLSKELQDTLSRAPEYQAVEEYISSNIEVVQNEINYLEEVKGEIIADRVEFPKLQIALELEAYKVLEGHIEKARIAAQAHIGEAIKSLNQIKNIISEQDGKFSIENEKFKKKYSQATVQQQQHKSLVDALSRLNGELRLLQADIQKRTNELKSMSEADGVLDRARASLQTALSDRTSVLKKAAEHTSQVSGGRVRATVKRPLAMARECADALVSILDKTGVQEKETKVRVQLRAMVRDFDASWFKLGSLLLEILRRLLLPTLSADGEDKKSVGDDLVTALGFPLTPTQTQNILSKLDVYKVAEVLQAAPTDHVDFEYQDGSRVFPFDRASPGQRAAALLFILLEQQTGPLIIDQPEDDLDNRAVMDLVEKLRTAKNRRQIIFATHNPNFVVNGDADKVVALGLTRTVNPKPMEPMVQIELDGAIETTGMRQAITAILEGGDDAFKLRSQKYDLSLD